MEGCRKKVTLPHGHGAFRFTRLSPARRQDFDPFTGADDDRRPDEDGVEGLFAERGNANIGLETVDLTPVGVTVDLDIDRLQGWERQSVRRLSQDDHPGARTPDRDAGPDIGAQ